jgi:hypothetical protein
LIRAQASIMVLLSMGPEGDLGMVTGQGDEKFKERAFQNRVIVEEPDAFCCALKGPFRTSVTASSEARIVVCGDDG